MKVTKRIKYYISFCLLIGAAALSAQPNCEAFKYYGDIQKYKACKAAEKRSRHHQTTREFQMALDEALRIDSSFAYAYRAKSTGYLKTGDMITYMWLMNKAVEYDPKEFLSYRGWCRYQFFKDYQGAIRDIERLDSLVDYDIGHSVNGFYHLHLARALCYKALGEKEKARLIIEQQMAQDDHYIGLFDYLHLGVLHLELGDYETAVYALEKQEQENDIAENRYYMAMAYKALGDHKQYEENLKIAKRKMLNEATLLDPYSEQMDKIYLADIVKELRVLD